MLVTTPVRRRLAAALTTAFALVSAGVVAPAAAAGVPETWLVTYSWSHTAHLATFNFATDAHDATFECSLTAPDAAPAWEACDHPTSTQYAELPVADYFFRVRARNAAGVDETPASRRFNIGVDQVQPETTLTTTAATTSRDATFHLAASEPATFECRWWVNSRTESRDYEPCTSPVVHTGLADGTYELVVRAIDTHGEYDTSPARHKWEVDATPPETTLSTTDIDGADASFGFTRTDGDVECTLEGPSQAHGWQPCASPTKYADLAPGTYTWQVAARDRHGNVDPTPGVHTWQVLPATGKVKGPARIARGTTARFRLSAAHEGSSYECKLDRGRWKACKTTHKVKTRKLKLGRHVLQVRAKAGGLLDPTPTKKRFRVVR